MIEPLLTQSRQLLYGEIRGQRCVISTALSTGVSRGDTVYLEFPSDRLYFFDRESGARIG
jgi:hypothetical protein